MKIYLAGKIGKNDWRHEIVPSLGGEWPSDVWNMTEHVLEETFRNPPKWPVLHGAIWGQHDYTGPYFIGCDHGCFHGPNRHGVGTNDVCAGCIGATSIQQKKVVHLCHEAISRSELVFAWIDSGDAYGTLAELGYAFARQKAIHIGFPESMRELAMDMWFVSTHAERVWSTVTPAEALRAAIDYEGGDSKPNYYEYILSDEWREKATAAKKRAGWRCQLCNGKGELHTHHRTYDRLGDELPDDLIVLCASCHRLFHENGKLKSANE